MEEDGIGDALKFLYKTLPLNARGEHSSPPNKLIIYVVHDEKANGQLKPLKMSGRYPDRDGSQSDTNCTIGIDSPIEVAIYG